METIIPEKETIEYLKNTKLTDLFPKSINFLTTSPIAPPQNPLYSQFLDPEENLIDKIQNQNYKLEKNSFYKIKYSSNTNLKKEITCICSYNNLLIIGSLNELKFYDISENFSFYGTFKTPGDDKNILCLAMTEINNNIYCLLGGEFSTIHCIDVLNLEEINKQLIGHKNKVYQLQIHPKNKRLLLSASKDCTVRLWDFIFPKLLVIFGGPNSFESDVLCIDWNFNGKLFVGSGVDCVVRIYQIDNLINENIEKIFNNKNDVKTLLKAQPFFSCNDIHDNLIDCIKFNNKFIISKSVDGVIKEWLPYKDINGQNSFFLINLFVFNTKQLIYGIEFCFINNLIVVGNELGQIFLFNKEKTELSEEVSNNDFFQNNAVQILNIDKNGNELLCKHIHYNEMNDLIFIGGNNNEIYIYKLEENN